MIKNETHQAVKSSGILDWRYLAILVSCTAAFGIAGALGRSGIVIPANYFVPIHLVLEYSSIVVSFAVFTAGWVGYKHNNNSRDLILALTFLVAGSLDFIHTLSYKGMPDFLGVNSVGKAAAYWLLARLVVGAGLLAAAFIKPEVRSIWLSARVMALACAGLVVGVAVLFTVYGEEIGIAVYDPARGGLTPLKIAIEYLSIAAYAVAFFAISEKRGWDERSVEVLRCAVLFAIFAELAFTLYAGPYDWFNVLGHIFKTAAYYLILNGIYVSAILRPYDQLTRTKEELQTLYLDAREHRKEIERSFMQIGNALSSSLELEAALDQITELAVEMLHVDCSIVVSLEKSGDVKVTAQKGGCHQPDHPVELTLMIGRRAIAQQKSITLNDLESSKLVDCNFEEDDCLRSMICAPMIHEQEALGIISIFSHLRNAFENGDVKLLEGFASHAAIAIHNALSYARESRIADVLQRSFLGVTKLITDKFEIAQVYESAASEALVGGDFYDVINMPGDRVGLVIGDVSGKGLQAAVHTAMVKYTLRAYINEGHSPAKIVELLNKAVSEATGPETFVTMFFGVLDTHTGELLYTNAGHEPPVYSMHGRLENLSSTGPALGFGFSARYEESILKLEPGSALLLYTDGVSEARRGKELLGTGKIGELMLECDGIHSRDLAKCVHSAAIDFAGGELKDDVAILAVRAL